MRLIFRGLEAIRNAWNRARERAERQVVDLRRRMARDLIIELIRHTPVWSGRTVRSFHVTSGPGGGNFPHPDRGNTNPNGPYRFHPEFGPTSKQSIGAERMRASSEAVALNSVDRADYSLEREVMVVSDHYLWPLVDDAAAPDPATARNQANIYASALQFIQTKYGVNIR